MQNQYLKKGCLLVGLTVSLAALPAVVNAQSVDQIRWKSESQVETILGAPNSKSTPIGTHASYSLWQYDDFTVAFADSKAFHLFKRNSMNKLDLNENRSTN